MLNFLSIKRKFPNVTFGTKIQFTGLSGMCIGEGSCIGAGVWLNDCVRDEKLRIIIGRRVLVGRGSMISSQSKLEIGDYTITGPNCCLSNANHVFDDIYQPIMQQGAKTKGDLVIEENCWIGFGVIIVKPVRVGRGSIVAAGSVVLEDIPPFSVVAGNPARLKKMYDFQCKKWQTIHSKEDYQVALESRNVAPPPTREEYQNRLNQNNKHSMLDPQLAG